METSLTNLVCLTLSWRRPLTYRNKSIDLQSKSMDWFLYDNDLRHERVECNLVWYLDSTVIYCCFLLPVHLSWAKELPLHSHPQYNYKEITLKNFKSSHNNAKKIKTWSINYQYCHHIKTFHLICIGNRSLSFYKVGILVLNRLKILKRIWDE